MDTLYREEILEHYKDPQNFGKIVNFTKSSRQTNPLCGDDMELFIKWDRGDKREKGDERDKRDKEDMRIKEISFIGTGCAISIAAASILTEFVKGKSKKELTIFSESDMLGLLGIEVSESRKKCAFLALYTLKDCYK